MSATPRSRPRIRKRKGQVIAITALMLPALVGITGLAIDGGMVYQIKRRAQSAADAGARAGTFELLRGNSTLVTSAARADSKLNGFEHDVNGTSVTVNNPPTSGARTGDNRSVEVIVARNVKTTFLRVINRQVTTVRARAVAGLVNQADGCVMALNPTASGTLTMAGTSTLTAPCGVVVNSTSSTAIVANGGACINASPSGVSVSGAWDSNGSANCISPAPETDTPPALDPLGWLPPPPIPSTVTANNYNMTGGTATLLPGLYSGGITISGGTATFSEGIYIIDGGDLAFLGNAIINNTGDGVMFYITRIGNGGQWGTVRIAGTTTVNLSAPDSGTYEGVLFWGDRLMPDRASLYPDIVGTSGSSMLGAIYFPSTQINYGGTSTAAAWNMIVGDRINIVGNAVVQGDYTATTVAPPTLKASLVE